MNFTNFEESNQPLGAGKGNHNTSPMRVMVTEHPDYPAGTQFLTGKFLFDDDDLIRLKQPIYEQMKKYWDSTPANERSDELMMKAILAGIKEVPMWVTKMHGWYPIVISMVHPFDYGHKKIIFNNPKDN